MEEEAPSVSARSRQTGRQNKPKPNSTAIIIASVVAFILLLGIIGLSGGRSGSHNSQKKTPEVELTDNTPSVAWAQRAKERLGQGNETGAKDDFLKAAEAAEREGNSNLAQNYNMQAYHLQKFTKVNVNQ